MCPPATFRGWPGPRGGFGAGNWAGACGRSPARCARAQPSPARRPTCPVLGPASGRSAPMPAPGRGDWTCPVGEGAASRLGRGHVHCWGWRVDRVPLCPLLAAATGHVRWGKVRGPDSAGGMSKAGAGEWTECPFARSWPRRLGMSGGGRCRVQTRQGACPLLGPASGQRAHMPTPGRGDWACPAGEGARVQGGFGAGNWAGAHPDVAAVPLARCPLLDRRDGAGSDDQPEGGRGQEDAHGLDSAHRGGRADAEPTRHRRDEARHQESGGTEQ